MGSLNVERLHFKMQQLQTGLWFSEAPVGGTVVPSLIPMCSHKSSPFIMCVVFEGGEWVMGIHDDTKLTMTSDPGLLLYLLCVFFHLLLLGLMHFNFEAKSFSLDFHLFNYSFILQITLFIFWGI